MPTWIKWRVYCITEDAWSEGILTENQGVPISCFNNALHTINTASHQQLEVLSDTIVNIKEETIPTNGYYKSKGYCITCEPGVTTTEYTFPHPITALSIVFSTDISQKDDKLETIVAPDTIIGVITETASPSQTSISVNSTVLEHASLGFFLTLSDGTNTNQLGIISNIDKINSVITFTTPIVDTFQQGTFVKISVVVIENFIFGYPGSYTFGESKIGGSHIPANTIIRVNYTNNGEVTKKFYPVIDYLY